MDLCIVCHVFMYYLSCIYHHEFQIGYRQVIESGTNGDLSDNSKRLRSMCLRSSTKANHWYLLELSKLNKNDYITVQNTVKERDNVMILRTVDNVKCML